jgi:hypothetical protein
MLFYYENLIYYTTSIFTLLYIYINHNSHNIIIKTTQKVPPNIIDMESTPSSVAVRENQSINMTCRAEGFPTPKIIWRREDGQSITVERKKKVMVYDGDILHLSKLSRNEVGVEIEIENNKNFLIRA